MEALTGLLSWIPAIVFPFAQGLQFHRIQTASNLDAFQPLSLAIIFIVNISSYIFASNYLSPKTLLAFVIPSFIIMGSLYSYSLKKHSLKKGRYILYSGIAFYLIGAWVIRNYGSILTLYSTQIGTITAILLPLAVLSQLLRMIKKNNAHGVSLGMWGLQLLGNLGCYVLVAITQGYQNPVNIIAYLLTAVLCGLILCVGKIKGKK